jgi:hypothetical protein
VNDLERIEREGPKDAPVALRDDAAPATLPPREPEVPTFLVAAHARMQSPAPVAVSVASSAGADLRSTADPDMRTIMATLAHGPLPFVRPDTQDASPTPQPGEEVDFALLPLETYAGVTRALARGEPREATLAANNLTAETFERMARAWARRLQGDPHLLARFRELAKGGASS